MPSQEPRFVQVSRRAFLARTAAVGALVTLPGLACATSDADVFAAAGTSTTSSSSTSTTTPSTRGTTATTRPPGSSTTSSPTTTPGSSSSEATDGSFPDGGELLVSFTFAAASGGRVNKPYIAVWIEDDQGVLVATVSLWFESGKGERWLPELRRWYAASDQGADRTTSSATRVAGAYTVTWDGTDLDGRAVPEGDYVVNIEAAREHGPYELVTGTITIGTDAFRLDLEPSGELTAAAAELVI